jgi:peroxiredoxin
MVFDRNAITLGRTILDFGLGDLQGAYQNTARLRGKGWLLALFFSPSDPNSAQATNILQAWTSELPGDKVSLLGISIGERPQVEEFAKAHNLTFPIVWDYEEYVATIWSITAIPTLFLTDIGGHVLAKIEGANAAKYDEAKSQLLEGIKKAEEAARAAAEAKAAADAAKAAEAAKEPAAAKK